MEAIKSGARPETTETTARALPKAPASTMRNYYVIVVMMAVAALGVFMTPRIVREQKDEGQIRGKVPMAFGSWQGSEDRYMGKEVYDMLGPDGIVWRIYENKPENRQLDFAMVVASHSSAFHDPTVCFTNQGQRIVNDELAQLNVASLGTKIPVRLLRLSSPNGNMTAVYWWRSAGGRNISEARDMQLDSWGYKLLGVKGREGYFFRVIVPESADRAQDVKVIENFVSDLFTQMKTTYPTTATVAST